MSNNPELDLMKKALLDVADTFQKAYNIAIHHVEKGKPKMSKDQFIDTYYPGPEFALLTVEFGMEREEIYSIYRRTYDKAHWQKAQEGEIGAR